jgi:hypothetical protein
MSFRSQQARELAARESEGIQVLLLWHPHENTLTVSVEDARVGDRFQLAVATDHASMPSSTPTPTRPDGRRMRQEPAMPTTTTRVFTPDRVVALGLIAVVVLALGYLRFAPVSG